MQLKPVTIYGAGFSGMSLALYLRELGFPVTIFETKDREGGLIETIVSAHGPSESAANAFLASHLVEELFSKLNITPQTTKPESRARFIFRRSKLRRWPLGLFATFKVIHFALRFFWNRKSVSPRPQESVFTWGHRVFGEEATQYLLAPALQGIYAGQVETLSASLILSRFFDAKKKEPRGRLRGSIAPPQGMGELMKALRTKLEANQVEFKFGEAANHQSAIQVFAGNAKDAALWLEKNQIKEASAFYTIRLLPLVAVTVFWSDGTPVIPGFGILFPHDQGVRALGVLANTNIFAGRGPHYNERWIYGGALQPELVTLSESELRDLIEKDRNRVFPQARNARILSMVVHRYLHGIPDYNLHLEEILQNTPREWPEKNIFLTGNYLGSIGLTKILSQNLSLARRMYSIYGN